MPQKKSGNEFGGDRENFRLTRSGGVVLTNDNAENRRLIESCYKRHKTMLNPIVDWTDDDVWNFIKQENVPYCELYDEGCKRIGCIGCPLAQRKQREREFLRWPKYKDAYMRAFDAMLEERRRRGKIDENWRMGVTAKDVFNWWMGYDVIPGQVELFDEE